MWQKPIIVILIVMCSCQSSKELHYLKQGENYYRLNINQKAFLTSSRYMSGNFDEMAVDYFFGELARPDSAKIVTPPVRIVSKEGTEIPENKNLIFILSTNSKEVADQIGNFASNEETLRQIALLSKKDIILEKKIINKNLKYLEIEIKDYIKIGDEFIEGIKTDDLNYSRQLILIYLNYIANLKGESQTFANVEEALNWIRDEF